MKLTHDSPLSSDELLLADGRKLIRLKVFGDTYAAEEANRNVFLVDSKGTEIWRVAYHECPHGNDSFHGSDPFVGIQVSPEGIVTGLTWDGWRFEINLADGSLKQIGWTKS